MILVLALDGLDPELIRQFQRKGQLPTLSALEREGVSGLLRSTIPPVSVPAWSTFLTGVGPGRHGLFDFTRLDRGRIRFQSAQDRGVPTLLELLDEAGVPVASLGVPTTYPVPRLRHGAVLAGFDSPFNGRPDARALHPEPLWRKLAASGLDLRASTLPEGRKGHGWYARAAERILASISRREAQARCLLGRGEYELLIVHFQAADTAGHHFFRYFDPHSPRHDAAHPDRAAVLPRVYDALDQAVGDLRRIAGGSATCVILSDHGMGPASERVIHLNAWLQERGFLVRRRRLGTRFLHPLRAAALAWLPRELQARLFRAVRDGAAAGVETALRLGEIDWERSTAFSEESSTLPGIWVLKPEQIERLILELRKWPAIRRVYRREDVFRGPLRGRAPHLLLDLRHSAVRTPPGYHGPACRRLRPEELDGVRGAGMNGVHRPWGVFSAAGPGIPTGHRLQGTWIGDLAPSLLARLGLEVPDWMEGRVLRSLAPKARRGEQTRPDRRRPSLEMTAAQAAALERRLRALGYLG